MTTLFTKIINKEVPAKIIYEDDKVVAFDDINPQAPIHKLIVPRKEIPSLNHLAAGDAEVIAHMMQVAKHLAKELAIADDGYRLVINCNAHGGQTVDHIHMHLLGGRQMIWPPG